MVWKLRDAYLCTRDAQSAFLMFYSCIKGHRDRMPDGYFFRVRMFGVDQVIGFVMQDATENDQRRVMLYLPSMTGQKGIPILSQ